VAQQERIRLHADADVLRRSRTRLTRS
jgi:hypothetical protein